MKIVIFDNCLVSLSKISSLSDFFLLSSLSCQAGVGCDFLARVWEYGNMGEEELHLCLPSGSSWALLWISCLGLFSAAHVFHWVLWHLRPQSFSWIFSLVSIRTPRLSSLTWPFPGPCSTETWESLPLAAGSHVSLKISGTGALPLPYDGPVIATRTHWSHFLLLSDACGVLRSLSQPQAPGNSPEKLALTLLLDPWGCLVVVVLVMGWGSLQSDCIQNPSWSREKPTHAQSSPQPSSHCSLQAENQWVFCLWSLLPLPMESPHYELQQISYPVVIQANLPEVAQDSGTGFRKQVEFPNQGRPRTSWRHARQCLASIIYVFTDSKGAC